MEPLKIGIVGLGAMGRQYVEVCKRIPECDLAGVFDIDPSICQTISARYGVMQYGALDALLADGHIDAVILCTPDHLHFDVFERVIRAGKHILIEKPLTTSVSEARKMVEISEQVSNKVMVGHVVRFDPRYYSAYVESEPNRVGELVHIYARRLNRVDTAMRVDGRTSVTMFLGVHDIDITMWIARSRIRSVSAVSSCKVLSRLNTPDTVMALLEFESGAVGVLEVSWVLPEHFVSGIDARLEAVFSNGVLYVDVHHQGLTLFSSDQMRYPVPNQHHVYGVASGPLRNQIEAFIHSIRNDSRPPVAAADAFNSVVVAASIDESLKSGARVPCVY